MTFMTIQSVDDLRQVHRSAAGGAVAKVIGALDERHVAWADYSGNNRLDSFGNLVDNARVGSAVPHPRTRRDALEARRRPDVSWGLVPVADFFRFLATDLGAQAP
jgi:hypothetical protein